MSQPRTATSNPPSILARVLAPLGSSVGVLFVVWTVLVAIAWGFGIGPVMIEAKISNKGLQQALMVFASALDPIWVIVAAVNAYFGLVRAEGIATARAWCVPVLLAGVAIPWITVATRWPLGPVHYTTRLGWQLGVVPFAVPLLWLGVIVAARETALRLRPRASHGQIAAFTAVLVALTSLNLEPHAWKLRSWWQWYPLDLNAPGHPPIQNLVTWALVAAGAAWMMRPKSVVPRRGKRPIEPVLVFAAMNAVFLLAHVAWSMRG